MSLAERDYTRKDHRHTRTKRYKPIARKPKSRITQTYYNLKQWFFRRKHPYSKLHPDRLKTNLGMVVGLAILLLIVRLYSDILDSIAIWFLELGTIISLILLYFIAKNLYRVFVNLRYGFKGSTNGFKLISIVLLILLSWQIYQIRDDFGSPNPLFTNDCFNVLSLEETSSNAIKEFFSEIKPVYEREEECKITFNYLNDIRRKNGRKELEWDDRAYKLAVARSKDMSERGYFDHITPEGTCAKDMKSEYGFKSGEILAENCGGMTHYAGGTPIPGTSVDEAVDDWMSSRGHRYNLLYEKHTRGAIGCYKSICVFYGVHNDPYGLGAGPCTSGDTGLAYWESAEKQSGEI